VALVLVDTNILLRLLEPSNVEYALVRRAVEKLFASGEQLCFAPQNLVEFWNVCTRPVEKNGFGLTGAETDARAKLIEAKFLFLPDNGRIHDQWRRLVVEQSVSGVQVHDARLVATMLEHGVFQLLTLNSRDFGRYPRVSAIHPRVVTGDDAAKHQ
jgi:predicted nucleic acid-binding protein